MKRTLLLIFSVVLFLFSIPFLIGGFVLIAVGSGDDPTIEGRLGDVSSAGHAVVSETVAVDWDFPLDNDYDLTLGVRSKDPATDVFLGYGPAADVAAYLDGVAHTVVESIGHTQLDDRDIDRPGTEQPPPPADQTFWVQSASGSGLQTIPVAPGAGNYRFVAMNADGSAGVDMDVYGSMTVPFLQPVGMGMVAFGVVLAVLAVVLLILGIRTPPGPTQAAPPPGYGSAGPPGYGPAGPAGYGAAGPAGYGPAGPAGYGPAGPGGYGPAGPPGYGPAGPAGYGAGGLPAYPGGSQPPGSEPAEPGPPHSGQAAYADGPGEPPRDGDAGNGTTAPPDAPSVTGQPEEAATPPARSPDPPERA